MKKQSVKDIKTKQINTLMLDINNQFSGDIQNHFVLEKIIDSYFKESQKFFIVFGFMYAVFNCLPFLL